MADYFSFEDVLNQLQLDEDELKRMVSEGELRAFRDDNKMIFRKDDVDSMKKGRITEPTIVLPSAGTTSGEGETLLDFGAESASEVIKQDDTSVPSIDVSSSDSGGAQETGETTGITEEMIFEDTDMPVAGSDPKLETSETYVEQRGPEETGGTTEPIRFQQDEAAMTDTEGTATDADEQVERSRTQPRARKVAVATKAPAGNPGFTVMLGFAAFFLILGGWCLLEYGINFDATEKMDKPSGFAHSVAGIGLAIFGGDEIKADWEKLGATTQ